MKPTSEFSQLVEIMQRLRDPETGCPWDVKQDFASIKPYTIEEAYEVGDAIDREDFDDLRDELGDLLLQPIFHAQMANEAGEFSIEDVILSINSKMIRRHPHVFSQVSADDPDAVKQNWQAIKEQENAQKKARKQQASEDASILDEVALALPALMRAQKLSARAARVGFEWENARDVLAKCREELDEVEEALAARSEQSESDSGEAIGEEIGDALFALVNLARMQGLLAEDLLSDANAKFVRRFKHVEARCAEDGISLEDADLERMDGYWNEIRARDKRK